MATKKLTKKERAELKSKRRVRTWDASPKVPSVSIDDFPDNKIDVATRKVDFLTAYAQNGSLDLSLEEADFTRATFRKYLLDGRFKEQFLAISGCLKSLAISETMHIMLNSQNEGMKLKAAEMIMRATDEGNLPQAPQTTYNINIVQAIDMLKQSPIGSEIYRQINQAQGEMIDVSEHSEDIEAQEISEGVSPGEVL